MNQARLLSAFEFCANPADCMWPMSHRPASEPQATMLDFSDPILQTYVTPFVVAALSVGLFRFFMGDWRGSVYPTLGIGIGFLSAFLLIHGLDLWPIRTAITIIPWVVLAGMAAGTLLDELNEPQIMSDALSVALPMGIGFWIGFEEFGSTLSIMKTIALAVTIVLGFWAMRRMSADSESGLASPLAAISTLIGFAIVFGGPDAPLGQLSLVLAIAIAGYAVWNWPKYRFPWGAASSLSVGAALTGIYGTWVVGHDLVQAIPPTLAFLSFLVFPVIERNLDLRPAAQPVAQLVLTLVPIAAATGAMTVIG